MQPPGPGGGDARSLFGGGSGGAGSGAQQMVRRRWFARCGCSSAPHPPRALRPTRAEHRRGLRWAPGPGPHWLRGQQERCVGCLRLSVSRRNGDGRSGRSGGREVARRSQAPDGRASEGEKERTAAGGNCCCRLRADLLIGASRAGRRRRRRRGERTSERIRLLRADEGLLVLFLFSSHAQIQHFNLKSIPTANQNRRYIKARRPTIGCSIVQLTFNS